VINLVLDSEFLGLVDSTSTTRTALSIFRLDSGRICINFGTLLRPEVDMTLPAVEGAVVAADGE
jgi:hypothetical protein